MDDLIVTLGDPIENLTIPDDKGKNNNNNKISMFVNIFLL